jgi:hypothetical protein
MIREGKGEQCTMANKIMNSCRHASKLFHYGANVPFINCVRIDVFAKSSSWDGGNIV